jgi:hypothetical protein
VAFVSFLIVVAMALVFYFMDAVYEVEQELDPDMVPTVVREQFERLFPSARDAVWEMDEGLYEVEFGWRQWGRVEAAFQEDGAWERSVFAVKPDDLPSEARMYLETQDGYEVVNAERIEFADGKVMYEAELSSTLMKWDVLFDREGSLVSRAREGPVLEGVPED